MVWFYCQGQVNYHSRFMTLKSLILESLYAVFLFARRLLWFETIHCTFCPVNRQQFVLLVACTIRNAHKGIYPVRSGGVNTCMNCARNQTTIAVFQACTIPRSQLPNILLQQIS